MKMMQNSGNMRKIDFFCKIADFSAFFAIQTRFFVVKSYHKNFGGTEGSTHMLKKGCVIKVMNEQSMNRSLKNRHLQMILYVLMILQKLLQELLEQSLLTL